MMKSVHLKKQRIIRDPDGHIVIWQTPNILLSGWIVFQVLAVLLGAGHLKSGFEQLSTMLLFAWACYEAAKGVNYFRKALGIVVLAVIVIGVFH